LAALQVELFFLFAQGRAEENEEARRRQHRAAELADDVRQHRAERETAPRGKGDGDGGIDVRAAETADAVYRDHDGDAPDDGDLPNAGLGAAQNRRVDRAAAEEDEQKGAERFADATGDERRFRLSHNHPKIAWIGVPALTTSGRPCWSMTCARGS